MDYENQDFGTYDDYADYSYGDTEYFESFSDYDDYSDYSAGAVPPSAAKVVSSFADILAEKDIVKAFKALGLRDEKIAKMYTKLVKEYGEDGAKKILQKRVADTLLYGTGVGGALNRGLSTIKRNPIPYAVAGGVGAAGLGAGLYLNNRGE